MTVLHRGENIDDYIEKIRECINSLNEIIESEPQFSDYGMLSAAHREYAEVIITRELMIEDELPSINDINVSKKAYIQALAESIGELRRHALDLLRLDEIDKAINIFERMEKVFDMLTEFDYPDSILSGFRRRRDVARRMIEKTRGDITNAARVRKLEESLNKVECRFDD